MWLNKAGFYGKCKTHGKEDASTLDSNKTTDIVTNWRGRHWREILIWTADDMGFGQDLKCFGMTQIFVKSLGFLKICFIFVLTWKKEQTCPQGACVMEFGSLGDHTSNFVSVAVSGATIFTITVQLHLERSGRRLNQLRWLNIDFLALPNVVNSPTSFGAQSWHSNTPLSDGHSVFKNVSQFLGAFVKLWKATISFVMSVCLSVYPFLHPHGPIQLPIHGFSQNLIFEYFATLKKN